MSEARRIMVMGIGNPLVRDEGIGPAIVEQLLSRFEFPDNVQITDCGTMGMTILNHFRECDHMIVVDAVDGTDEDPGTVMLLTPDEIAPNQVLHSLHDMRFIDVLQAAELLGSAPTAVVVGIQVADIGGLHIGLTPPVEAAIPAAIDAVLELLAEQGVVPVARGEDEDDSAAAIRSIRSMNSPSIDFEGSRQITRKD